MNPILSAHRAILHLLLAVGLAFPCFAPAQTPATEPATTPAVGKTNSVENSVVKIFSTVRYPDYYRPWTKQAPAEVSGSGVVIEGHRILTNAHVVAFASQVQVQANQAGDKISATVVAFAPGIDLAILKLDDETLFDAHQPLARAPVLPNIKDAVLAYGYPTGGQSLSITKGIISRIEYAPYNFPAAGIRIQIDAAINPGNSGGPALVEDKMIGLAFSQLANAQNIGYIIPNEEIELFLKDVAAGRTDSKPAMFDALQTLENPALRTFLKLDKDVQGMVVNTPYSGMQDNPLKPWDVITHIGDSPIDDQGMIKLGDNLRIRFQYLIQQVAHDGKVPLTVVRNRKPLKIAMPVGSDRPALVANLRGDYPPYFVYGPLVFSLGSSQFVGGYSNNSATLIFFGALASPLLTRLGDLPAFPDEQLVVVSSPFFPHKLVKGYGQAGAHVVRSVNGVIIRNLAHLVELLRDSKDEFLIFEFAGREMEKLVFNRSEMVAATEEILSDNGVRAQATPGLLEIWNAKPTKK
ncbi:MAG: trypsin-like peptidase domain-containing protein [Opitutae bacterium]|nr:trypsin-like peptidase domain-containing protein [Opitutae bacterium]